MTKITYDPEVKILMIRLNKRKIADSDLHGNCVVDYDSKGDIVNIEVMDINIEDILTVNKENPLIEIK